MSLYRRGNIWWCGWKIGGARIRETTGTADRTEAQEYHDKRRAELWRESRLAEKRIPSWDEACLAWCTEHACNKSSYADDKSRLRWINPQLTGKALTAINKELLIELRTRCAKGTEERGPRSPATCNKHLAIVSAVLNYAKDKSQIPSVPKIPYFSGTGARLRYLTHEEATKLLKELPEHLKQITRFGLATGLRRTNITLLQWENIDLGRRVAWVWPDEAKAKKAISIPLNDAAVAVLQEQLGKDPVFVFTYRGTPLYHVKTRAWDSACERAGVSGIDFHTIRHTWASWHVMAGTPLDVLMKLGGWSSMTMVLRYAHLHPGYLADYAGNVSRVPHKKPTAKKKRAAKKPQVVEKVGWRTGLEPATTGITILRRRTGAK